MITSLKEKVQTVMPTVIMYSVRQNEVTGLAGSRTKVIVTTSSSHKQRSTQHVWHVSKPVGHKADKCSFRRNCPICRNCIIWTSIVVMTFRIFLRKLKVQKPCRVVRKVMGALRKRKMIDQRQRRLLILSENVRQKDKVKEQKPR